MASENEKRETLAAIVAEMFDFSDKRIEEGRNHAMTSESVGLIVHQLAKRLEAAWKREPVGNAAAMREACAKMRDLLMLRGDGKAYCVLSWDEFNESQKMLRAALAAPARNCDRFTSIEEARTAYCSECGRMISIWDETELWLFEEWLFATASEKGEGDGR